MIQKIQSEVMVTLVCVCVRACVRALRACVRCVRACVRACICVSLYNAYVSAALYYTITSLNMCRLLQNCTWRYPGMLSALSRNITGIGQRSRSSKL